MLTVRQRLNVSSSGAASSSAAASVDALGAPPGSGTASSLAATSPAAEQLVLPFELRQKSRLRARLASGLEVGLFLERGTVLRGGDLLLADDGTVIEVVAARETVSTVHEAGAARLARAGYHLGNRHVPVEIGAGWLRYRHDHVLDDMVRGLGSPVVVEQAPFEPESGAYGAHGHSHSHEHGGDHQHSHEHGGAPAPHSHSADHTLRRGFGVLLDPRHDDRGHDDPAH